MPTALETVGNATKTLDEVVRSDAVGRVARIVAMEDRASAWVWIARIVGIGLHVPMLLIFIVQGLVVPTEGVLFLVGVWVALLIVGIALWRRESLFIGLVPIVDVVTVYAVTAIGSALFGWRP